jgi:Tfp pilus assembly protein PilX
MSRPRHQNANGRRARRSREEGIALIVVMLILALVSVLAVSSMETTMRDQQVAGIQMRDRVAFQAAEAGMATALVSVTGSNTPTLATASIGVSGDYPMGQPSYQLDPKAATPIENMGSQPAPGMSLNINGNGPKFQMQLWRIKVEGREPRGMNSRVEAAAAALWGS